MDGPSNSLTQRRFAAAGIATLAGIVPDRAGGDDLHSGVLRDEVVEILRSDVPDVAVTLDADPGQIRIGTSTLFLDNLNARVADLTGTARRAAIVAFVRPAAGPRPARAAPAETFMQASGRLRIQLVPNEYREQAAELTCRRFSDRLLVAYALDEANRYQLVTRPIFDAWGVDQATVERTAVDNLGRSSGGAEIHVSATRARGQVRHPCRREQLRGRAPDGPHGDGPDPRGPRHAQHRRRVPDPRCPHRLDTGQ